MTTVAIVVFIGLAQCRAFGLQTTISSAQRGSSSISSISSISKHYTSQFFGKETQPPSMHRVRQLCLSNNSNDEDPNIPPPFTDRFLSPRIDDIGLPLADGLVAQIVAPTFQVFWLTFRKAPLPTWLTVNADAGVLFASSARQQGGLLAPVLIHGAGLAVCWIAGALAARGFESDAFDVGEETSKGYGEVIKRILQAGSFATGLLVLGTQIDLLFEFGRFVQPGESEAIDVRLVCAFVELFTDVLFEALVLGSWRLYRASLTADRSGRP